VEMWHATYNLDTILPIYTKMKRKRMSTKLSMDLFLILGIAAAKGLNSCIQSTCAIFQAYIPSLSTAFHHSMYPKITYSFLIKERKNLFPFSLFCFMFLLIINLFTKRIAVASFHEHWELVPEAHSIIH
ncbi:hypothetical protein ACJX0J_016812, partial [Zea mays]